jgi:hypothetical protein
MKVDTIDPNSYRPLKRAVDASYSLLKKKTFKGRCRHFSFVFDRSKLVSFGCNTLKTHPWKLRFSYKSFTGTHSELRAVINSGLDDFKGMTIVNTRINRNGHLDCSFPCECCLAMIKDFCFKDAFFTLKDGSFGRVKFF